MQLSIIVPAYNEETRIARMLDAYLPFFSSKYGHEFEMIVVINGSTDGTEDIVRKYSRTYDQLKIIVEPLKIGKGGAVRLGFRKASAALIGFVDADGSTPSEAFHDLVLNIGSAGAVIASRWHKESNVILSQPLSRRIASRVFSFLVNILFRLHVSDTQCGAKLFTREAVKKVLPNLGITRWAFDVDLLFQLSRAGYQIREIPTTWHNVKGSKLKIRRASVQMFFAIVRLRLIYSPFKWLVPLYTRTIGRVIPPHW